MRVAVVGASGLHDLLGKRLYSESDPYKKPRAGVVMGLAWTSMGGSTLYIEAVRVASKSASWWNRSSLE